MSPTHDRPPVSTVARLLIAGAVLAAGICGALIGYGVADLQCTGSCSTQTGVAGLLGGVVAAAGTAVIAVLALHAMAEWRAQEGRRRSGD